MIKLMNRRSFLFLCSLSSSVFAEKPSLASTWQWPCMGSQFKCIINEGGHHSLKDEVRNLLERLELIFSVHRPDSEALTLCRQANQSPGVFIPVSEDLFQLTQLAADYTKKTGGYFDVTFGSLTNYWRYCKSTDSLPNSEKVERLKKRVGADQLRFREQSIAFHPREASVLLDYGGIAKGYAVDCVIEVLKKAGVTSAVINLGGEISSVGPKGQTIKLLDRDGARTGHSIILKDAALSTSGDLYQAIEVDEAHRSHVVTRANGGGLRENMSITVQAENSTQADILSTAAHAAQGTSEFSKIVQLSDRHWVT